MYIRQYENKKKMFVVHIMNLIYANMTKCVLKKCYPLFMCFVSIQVIEKKYYFILLFCIIKIYCTIFIFLLCFFLGH